MLSWYRILYWYHFITMSLWSLVWYKIAYRFITGMVQHAACPAVWIGIPNLVMVPNIHERDFDMWVPLSQSFTKTVPFNYKKIFSMTIFIRKQSYPKKVAWQTWHNNLCRLWKPYCCSYRIRRLWCQTSLREILAPFLNPIPRQSLSVIKKDICYSIFGKLDRTFSTIQLITTVISFCLVIVMTLISYSFISETAQMNDHVSILFGVRKK